MMRRCSLMRAKRVETARAEGSDTVFIQIYISSRRQSEQSNSLDHSRAVQRRRNRKTPLRALAPVVSANVVQLHCVRSWLGVALTTEHHHRVLANGSDSVEPSRVLCRCRLLPRRRPGTQVEQRNRLLPVIPLHGEHCASAPGRRFVGLVRGRRNRSVVFCSLSLLSQPVQSISHRSLFS